VENFLLRDARVPFVLGFQAGRSKVPAMVPEATP
jgi:hypothetical protein